MFGNSGNFCDDYSFCGFFYSKHNFVIGGYLVVWDVVDQCSQILWIYSWGFIPVTKSYWGAWVGSLVVSDERHLYGRLAYGWPERPAGVSLSSLTGWETSGNNTPNSDGLRRHKRLNGMNLSLNIYYSAARNDKDVDVPGQCQLCYFCGFRSLCVTEPWPTA